MPVIHLRATSRPGVAEAIRDVRTAVADVLGEDPSGTWCTFLPLEAAEPEIVYVDVWISSRGADVDGRVLEAACRAAAGGLRADVADVWGTVRHVEPGRIFAGGGMIQ
jgi:hypothetical protein